MDLSLIAGLNLTEDQITAINAASAADVSAATTGLVNKNNELIGEKKTALQNVADNATALEDARKAASTLAEEKLLAEGKYTEALALREQENAELTASANEKAKMATEALDKYHRGSALNSALDLIHTDYKDLAKAQLSNMLKISYNDAGEAITTFEHDGKVIANNVSEFGSWASEQSAFKKILNGVDSGGAGVTPSHGGRATNQNDALSNLSQRLKSQGLT